MATVMLASITFVVTFQVAPSGTDAPRESLRVRLRDVLAILNDTPVSGSEMGDNEMSVSLLECMQGSCSRLTTQLDRMMPTGSLYSVYLATGDGLYPVYAPRSPGGEAVTARRPLEPAWSYQFMGTSQSVFNPLEDPLVVYALPVANVNPVVQGGSALSIVATGNRSADHASYVLKASGSTRAVASGSEPTSAAISLFFHNGSGAAQATRDATAQTILVGTPTGTPVSFSVRIWESGGGLVPAGTMLSVEIPHGWNATASQAVNDADWIILGNATSKNATSSGSTVSARLMHSVSSGSVDLVFNGTYVGDADDHYPFAASLTAGAYANAALLVRADDHVLQPDFEVPTLLVSTPRPLGEGAVTTWTIAGFSPDPSVITRVEVQEEEGRSVFANVTGLAGGGSWTTTGSKLIWTGSHTLDQDTPLSLTFNVTSIATKGPDIDRAPFIPSIQFGNYSGALTQQVAPGMHRGVFLPAAASYRGYDPSFTGLSTVHSFTSDSVYRTTALPGTLNYTVGAAVGMKDSIFGSAVTPSERRVTPGGSIDVAIEAQSIIYHLGVLGLEPSIELNIYPPWAGSARAPLSSSPLYNGTIAKGNGTFLSLIDLTGDLIPDATDVGRLSTSVRPEAGWPYGAYVLEAKVTWLDALSVPPLTETILRSARVYDYFVLEPTTGPLPSSPVYDVHIVAWMQDWG